MINEANGTMTHDQICRMIVLEAEKRHVAAAREFTLPNGKIADIAYLTKAAAIVIVEVKATFRPHMLSDAHRKYGHMCNYLWLAIPATSWPRIADDQSFMRWATAEDAIGIVLASWEGLKFMREAQVQPIAPINARTSMSRLSQLVAAGEPPHHS